MDDVERGFANEVFCEWILSEDPGKRFDATALIRKFRVTEAIPALALLNERLEHAEGPGAQFEREKG